VDNMPYYVYHNWTVQRPDKIRLHFSECPYCNHGNGLHPGASTKYGRWHGPFDTLEPAMKTAQSLHGEVTLCKHCNPN
jgi:hypothetical protein